jgi:hypothetical protein
VLILAALAVVLLVGALLLRARSLARFRRGQASAAPWLLGSTLAIATLGIGAAAWVALRRALTGVPVLCGVALLAGLWIRQTGRFISVDLGARRPTTPREPTTDHEPATKLGPTTRPDRLLVPMVSLARVGSAALLSLGFAGLVACIIYLLFRSRF